MPETRKAIRAHIGVTGNMTTWTAVAAIHTVMAARFSAMSFLTRKGCVQYTGTTVRMMKITIQVKFHRAPPWNTHRITATMFHAAGKP